jgi:hypothetical protein
MTQFKLNILYNDTQVRISEEGAVKILRLLSRNSRSEIERKLLKTRLGITLILLIS